MDTSLIGILSEMDLPKMRLDVTKTENVWWLLRNIAIRNRSHPRFQEAVEALKALSKKGT
jgi:hypothetical protein